MLKILRRTVPRRMLRRGADRQTDNQIDSANSLRQSRRSLLPLFLEYVGAKLESIMRSKPSNTCAEAMANFLSDIDAHLAAADMRFEPFKRLTNDKSPADLASATTHRAWIENRVTERLVTEGLEIIIKWRRR